MKLVEITLPKGIEYTDAEILSGSGKSSGDAGIELDLNGTHASVARVHWSTHGVVR